MTSTEPRRRPLLIAAVAVLGGLGACAEGPSGGGTPPGGLAGLAWPRSGTPHRAIGEAVTLAPGASVTLLDTPAAGRIEHIWTTLNPVENDPYALRAVRLEAWWDGVQAVEVPLGDFFGNGHGVSGVLVTEPVTASAGGGLACYWPMPFTQGARIVATNDGPAEHLFFWQVDWVELPAAEVEPTRFQASWRQNERPAPMGLVTVADIKGTGHYVGSVMAVTPQQRSWWGEGDDIYIVDGQRLQGTGTEDTVNQAWGTREWSSPYAAVVDAPAHATTLVRWFVHDPIPFRSSLVVQMEQLGYKWQGERDDDFAATAFWYQTPPLSRVPDLPPFDARLSASRVTESEVWALPGPATPLALPAGLPDTRAKYPAPGLDPAATRLAGVDVRLQRCGAGACGVLVSPGAPLRVAIPADADAVYLLVAGGGRRYDPLGRLTVGGVVADLKMGDQLEGWDDPWPVPSGRIVTLSEPDARTVRGAYMIAVRVPEGARDVLLEAGNGRQLGVWAVSAGPAPADLPPRP